MRLILSRWFYFGKNVEKYGNTAISPGGYGRIGEIPHGQLRPDWGLKG